MRIPYVGHGIAGARASAQIDREEAHCYELGSAEYERCMESARRWDDQAEALAIAPDDDVVRS